MSLSQNPMTGEMHRSMANFVTTVYRGQNVIKTKVFMPKNVNSAAQQKQRACFKLVVDTYDSFGGITDQGFPGRPRILSPYNEFMLANLPNAVDKTGAEPVIDYTKLVVASGTIPQVVVTAAVAGGTGIVVSYKTPTGIPKILPTDEVVAFVKTKIGELAIARQPRGTEAIGTILIPHQSLVAGDVECCYVFALTADGSDATKSTYVPVS